MNEAEMLISDRKNLPRPQGYRILVAIPDREEKTKGGVILPDKLKDAEKTASVFGCVLALGPDAYKDEVKFPNGAYCKEGDWVVFRSYTGTRLKINGHEVRLINDDAIEAVTDDPRNLSRA